MLSPAAAAALAEASRSTWQRIQSWALPAESLVGVIITYLFFGDRLFASMYPSAHGRIWHFIIDLLTLRIAPLCGLCCGARASRAVVGIATGILKRLNDLTEDIRKHKHAASTLFSSRGPPLPSGFETDADAAAAAAVVVNPLGTSRRSSSSPNSLASQQSPLITSLSEDEPNATPASSSRGSGKESLRSSRVVMSPKASRGHAPDSSAGDVDGGDSGSSISGDVGPPVPAASGRRLKWRLAAASVPSPLRVSARTLPSAAALAPEPQVPVGRSFYRRHDSTGDVWYECAGTGETMWKDALPANRVIVEDTR